MKYLIITLGIAFICSCESAKESDDTKIIDASLTINSVKLSELIEIDSVREIKFDTLSRFGDIKKTFCFKDKILAHTDAPSTLSLINQNGKIEKQYIPDFKLTEISSVAVFANKIYVLDRESMEIHLFSRTLDYQRKISIPFFAQSFQILDENTIALYVGNEITDNIGRLVIYNINSNEIIYDHLKVSMNEKRYFNFLTSYNFFESNDITYFWNSPQNEIIQIGEEGQISDGFYLNYGKKGVPEDFYEQAQYENAYEFIQDTRNKGYSHRHFKILANDNFILIHFDNADQFGTTLYNIESGKSKTSTKVIDDIWRNDEMEDIILSFFIEFYGESNFVSFLPFEYIEESTNTGLPKNSDYLVFGRLKSAK